MPDAAERKVLELANAVEADHAGRRHQHAISEAGGEEYGAAVKAAIAHGWLTMHPSGAYLSSRKPGRSCSRSGNPKGTLGRALAFCFREKSRSV